MSRLTIHPMDATVKPSMCSSFGPRRAPALLALAALAFGAAGLRAQQPEPGPVVITGRVLDAASHEPIPGALVSIEGTRTAGVSDAEGRYRLARVPPGPQVLRAQRIGYALARFPITVPTGGAIDRDITLGRAPLRIPEIVVTADPAGRARGELGTASVIDRAGINNQTAASLAGVLELVPGVPLAPPGLDNVSQIALRSVPTSRAGFVESGPSAADLASFGTLILLDGVPLTNNANLQTTGPRGELSFLLSSSSGGGIDLRRIPASTIERVEVIRGLPSARYGDLTQGAIVVDTRASALPPELLVRYDARSIEASAVGGHAFGTRHTVTSALDVTHTRVAPGLRDDNSYRISTQLAHRAGFGGDSAGGPGGRLVLDTRVDFYQLVQNNPEQPDVVPGRASLSRDNGLRISERARLALPGAALELTASLEHIRQRSYVQSLLIRPAMPFTDRLDEGRAFGRYIGGLYLSRLTLNGDPWHLYARLEGDATRRVLGSDHRVRAGAEVRREWNAGPGYGFDIEFPPQVTFNGVQGFDRPRRYDAIPPIATSAFYVDDRAIRVLPGQASLDIQAGLRVDVLHRGTSWLSAARDVAAQPRLSVQLAPRPWLRLRGSVGRTAKVPSLGSLYPAPQYYDVVNVNWFPADPAERLAVLTTFIRDPTNPSLGFSRATKREAGIEFDLGRRGSAVSLVAFSDRTTGAVGFRRQPDYLLRDRYDLSDSTLGTGRPPAIIEPPSFADTVPILVDQPANNLTLLSSGYELTATLPEFRPLRTRLNIQGAWTRTRLSTPDLDFGLTFDPFQLDERQQRAPYWDGATRTGQRLVITYRLIHHQPQLGLVVTVTVQQTARESRRDVGGTDSLAFAGYITRSGRLVPVPASERADPQYRDLYTPRTGLLAQPRPPPGDWLLSLQVAKTLPLDGRLSFYAFNALSRLGRYGSATSGERLYPPMRFGVEAQIALAPLFETRR